MKQALVVILAFALIQSANAGLIGIFTAKARDWEFVENSGGLVLHEVEMRNGELVLPVEYSPVGHSGLIVRKISIKRKGGMMVLRVFTQVAEDGVESRKLHYLSLFDYGPGTYRVHYGKISNPEKLLGNISVPK